MEATRFEPTVSRRLALAPSAACARMSDRRTLARLGPIGRRHGVELRSARSRAVDSPGHLVVYGSARARVGRAVPLEISLSPWSRTESELLVRPVASWSRIRRMSPEWFDSLHALADELCAWLLLDGLDRPRFVDVSDGSDGSDAARHEREAAMLATA